MNFRTRGPIYYLLQAPSRQVVVGNLPGMPPVEGVVDFVRQTDDARARGARRPSSPASASPCPTARSSWWRRMPTG